jgi:hypothetical protein
MDTTEKNALLSEHLVKFRTWSHAELAKRIGEKDCLERVEGKAADGTEHQIEINVDWDDKSNG